MASTYSDQQLAQYIAYVSLPKEYHPASNPALDLNYLTALHVHQISTVPFENLTLHYSPTHKILLNPQVLFKKIVTDARGRGG